MLKARTAHRKRNRGYEETHRELIETAVRLLSESGVDALSVSGLAREAGLNRTTIYYHFPNREAMLCAVKEWSAQQLALGMDVEAPQLDRMAHITRFVLENPQLIKLWIEDFISPGDIRDRYPRWDDLVAGLSRDLQRGQGGDGEVYALMLLTGAIIGPRVFHLSVSPQSDADEVSRRFIAEAQRQLAKEGLMH